MPNGRFITLEGGEGAGKSTQIKWLAEALQYAGIATLSTREPGGSPGGEAIRALLVSGGVDRWHPITESMLFMAARVDHYETKIRPELERGSWVVCDRFHDSTAVYQGIGKAVGVDWLAQLYRQLLGNAAPDLTLLLDLPPKVGLARATKRGNVDESRFEQMEMKFHESVREGFLSLARQSPERIHIIDATPSAEEVHRAIIRTVNARFGLALVPLS